MKAQYAEPMSMTERLLKRLAAVRLLKRLVAVRPSSGAIGPMLLAAGALVLLPGCWDRREVNDIAIVSGMALDMAKDGQYRIAVQFPLAGQLGGPGGGGGGTSGGKSWYLDSGTGKTLKEADSMLQRSLPRVLYYSHRRIFIIGEEAAKKGIATHLDITVRTSQNRQSALVMFAKGDAINVLNTDAVLEQQPAEMLREITISSMKKPITIKDLVNTLVTEGYDVAAPYYYSSKAQVGSMGEAKSRITLGGLAIFKGDKLVGLLKGETAKGVLWAMDQAKRPIISVPSPEGEGNFTIQFSENKVDLVPTVKGDEITMEVNIRATGNLFENQSSYRASNDNLSTLTSIVTEALKSNVEKSVKVLQEYKSDVCGFGDMVHRKKPKVWEKIKSDWYNIYSTMKVNVNVELQLEHSGTIVEPAAKSWELLNQ